MTILTAILIPAETARVGDKFLKGEALLTIAKVTTGRKWTTARTAEGKLVFEAERAAEVQVNREIKTDEEKAAERAQADAEAREYFCGRILRTLKGWAEAEVTMDANAMMDYSALATGLETSAKRRMALEILAAIEFKQGQEDNSDDVLATVEGWSKRAVRSAMQSGTRTLSRSSSVTSNLIEDVQRGVLFDLVDSIERGYLY